MNDESAGQPEQADAAKVLREDVKKLTKGTRLDAKLGGPAAEALDQQDSSERGEALIGIGAFAIILVTLLIIFRAPILAVLPLILIGIVSAVANGLIAYATKLFNLQANSSISSMLIVVLFGVGTDYFLFLMFRYRECLRAGDEPKQAMINVVGRVGEAIACAAGAVIIAFLAAGQPAVHWDRLLFSAKESVYKAWFPLTGKWLGFEDADIELHQDPGTGRTAASVPNCSSPDRWWGADGSGTSRGGGSSARAWSPRL